MTQTSPQRQFRAFSRLLAREIDQREIDSVAGGLPQNATWGATWTEEGSDKEIDFEESY